MASWPTLGEVLVRICWVAVVVVLGRGGALGLTFFFFFFTGAALGLDALF